MVRDRGEKAGEFARPFRMVCSDGLVLHGVQFPPPDGRCVLALPMEIGGFDGATAFGHLPLPEGAVVEWQDGGQP